MADPTINGQQATANTQCTKRANETTDRRITLSMFYKGQSLRDARQDFGKNKG